MVLDTKEYISDISFKSLKQAKEQGQLFRKQIRTPLWLRGWQAKELGFNQGEEDFLLEPLEPEEGALFGRIKQPSLLPAPAVTTVPAMPKEAPVAPTTPSLPPIEPSEQWPETFKGMPLAEAQRLGLYPTPNYLIVWPDDSTEYVGMFLEGGLESVQNKGGKVYKLPPGTITPLTSARVQPTLEEENPIIGLLRKVYPSFGLSEANFLNDINQRITEDPDKFLEDLRLRGKSQDTIQVLQMFSSEPLTQEDINQFFQGMPEITPQQNLLMKALPLIVRPTTIAWATKKFGDNPDALRRELITAGRNPDTEALVKSLYPRITERGLRDYFSARVPKMEEWPIVSGGKAIRTLPVTFLDDPMLWWRQYREKSQAQQESEQKSMAMSRERFGQISGITGWANRPTALAGLSPADIVGLALIAYATVETAKIGWDMFLRASLLRNLNSWAKSAGVEIPDETKNGFINQAMVSLSKKYLSQQALKTIFKPTKAGFQASPQTASQVESEILALVQREATSLIPRATQTGAMVFGGVPSEPILPTIASVAKKIFNRTPLTPEEEQFRVNNREAVEAVLRAGAPIPPEKVTPAPAITAEERLQQFAIKKDPISAARQLGYEVHKLSPKDTVDAGVYSEGYRYRLSKPREGQPYPDIVMAKNEKEIGDYLVRQRAISKAEIPEVGKIIPEKGIAKEPLPEAIPPKPTPVAPTPTKGAVVAPEKVTPAPEVTKETHLNMGRTQGNRLILEEAGILTPDSSDLTISEIVTKLDEIQAKLDKIPTSRLGGPQFRKLDNARITLLKLAEQESGLSETGLRNVAEGLPPPRVVPTIPKAEAGITEVEARLQTQYPNYEYIQFFGEEGVRYTGEAQNKITGERITVKATTKAEAISQLEAKLSEAPAVAERPLPAVPELTSEEVAEQWSMLGQPRYNLKQIDALVAPFAEYIMNPNTITAYELARQTLALQRSERFNNLKAKLAEIQVQTGTVTEEQARQIITDTLSGKYWVEMTDYLDFITGELRDAHFAKVAHVLKDYPAEYAGTITALVNALAGRPIPNIRPTPPPGGFKSVLWPQGASALDKLQYVFGKGTRHMKALEKMATEKKPLDEVVEGVFRETGQAPIPIDPKSFDYLESLPTWAMEQTLELDVLGPRVKFTYNPTGKLGLQVQGQQLQMGEAGYRQYKSSIPEKTTIADLRAVLELDLISNEIPEDVRKVVLSVFDKSGLDAAFDRLGIEMASSPQAVTPTKYTFDAPIERAFTQKPLMTFGERQMLVRVLKEIGMSPMDIGNLWKALKATFDNSFLRQAKVLASGHPKVAFAAYVTSWQNMFSQKHAEAEWQLITRDPDYELYEQIRLETGYDPLRIPALAMEKGTRQWRTAEEFGFPTVERLIPRITAKLPVIRPFERAFTGGTNKVVWLLWKMNLNFHRRYALKVASGEVKLKEGEAVNIVKEMTDFQAFLGDAIQRANLGKFSEAAPFFGSIFFALRSKLGRFFFPRHLLGIAVTKGKVGFNPRIMKEAWRDFIMMNAIFGGLMFLGEWLGIWDVEKDPRNAEFMSARIGKTRIDPWAGYRQFVVLYARLVTGTGISSVTGAEYEVNKLGALNNFIRGSFAPMLSTLLDFWTGRNFLGEVVEVTNGKEWLKRILPFSVVDYWEAMEEDQKVAALLIVPAFHGEGVQTYTGDWKDNWKKLGEPKYLENTAYGIFAPPYDTADWWKDTAHQFKGVDPATLTKEKGFLPQVRALAEALVIIEHLETLPSERLASLNADPSKGATFGELRELWSQRQTLVDAGDKAEFVESELQPDGTYKEVTYKGDKAVTAFDKHEFTFRAVTIKGSQTYNGNLSQRQFALLNDYWSITDKRKQAAFLEEHKAEIGVKPRDEYLRTHPKENAQLAVWGQAKILTREAYNQFKAMVKELDIPDSVLPKLTLPPEGSLETHWKYEEMVSAGTHGSWEAQLLLKQDAQKAKEGKVQSYVEWRTKEGEQLKLSDTPIASLELKTEKTYRATYLKLNDEDDSDWVGNLDDKIKDEDGLTAKDKAIAKLKATKIPGTDLTYGDMERKVKAIEKGTDEAPIDEKLVNAYVDRGRLIDKPGLGSGSAEVMLQRVDNPDFDKWLINKDIWGDDALVPIEIHKIPEWRITANNRELFDKLDGYGDRKNKKLYIADEDDRETALETLRATKVGDKTFRDIEVTRDILRKNTEDYTVPQTVIDAHVGYVRILDQEGVGSGSAEAMLYRVDNLEYDAFRTNPDVWGDDVLQPIDKSKIREWKIEIQFQDLFDERQNILDTTVDTKEQNAKIQELFAENPAFQEAYYRHAGYKLGLSDEHAEDYVTVMLMPEKGWGKERYMKLHPEFFEEIQRIKEEKEKSPWMRDIKWDEIPSEQVEALWFEYDAIPTQLDKQQQDFRIAHPDLDAWLVLTGKVKRLATEERRRTKLTPREKSLEDIFVRQSEFEKKIAELRKKLGGL